MSRDTPVDRRVVAVATGLIFLGTVVRVVLSPDPAEFEWRPAPFDRSSEMLSQARSRVDSALLAEASAALPLATGERIDINTADVTELRRLPGVGRSRAAAIAEDRLANGPYRTVQELARVPGIGPGLIGNIIDHVKTTYDGNASVRSQPRGRLDLNRAQIKELEQITGIGPALASRIAAARLARGRFRELEELLEIPGIGPKTLQILREEAYVR